MPDGTNQGAKEFIGPTRPRYFHLVLNVRPYCEVGRQTTPMIPRALRRLRKFRSIFFRSAVRTFPRKARSFFSALTISLVMLFNVNLTLAIPFSFAAPLQLR